MCWDKESNILSDKEQVKKKCVENFTQRLNTEPDIELENAVEIQRQKNQEKSPTIQKM